MRGTASDVGGGGAEGADASTSLKTDIEDVEEALWGSLKDEDAEGSEEEGEEEGGWGAESSHAICTQVPRHSVNLSH